MVHPPSHRTLGTAATPDARFGRWRRRSPQTNGWRWAFQYPVARPTARAIWSHVSNRRPFSANDRSTFHHGSIRFRYAAYVGWNTNSHRGCARLNSSTSVARWADKLSSTAYTAPTSAGTHASTRSRKSIQLAVVRPA